NRCDAARSRAARARRGDDDRSGESCDRRRPRHPIQTSNVRVGEMSEDTDAVILSACRTPIGSFGGVFKDLTAVDLGAVVVREAIARSGVKPADLGDVILGCVLQAGAGMNVARQAALKAGVPVEVPAETVNRVCGSGMQ